MVCNADSESPPLLLLSCGVAIASTEELLDWELSNWIGGGPSISEGGPEGVGTYTGDILLISYV